MKQKDIALIVVIAGVSATMSFILSNKVFVTPETREQSVETVDKIEAAFVSPSIKYFNDNSINPTQDSTLGGEGNQNPFNGGQ